MSNSTLISKKDKNSSKSEFEKYLEKKSSNLTYKGIKLETEGWRKKFFCEEKND